MTGRRRVLEQLRRAPVTIADFDRQPAVDGGPRITRLAARIQELKEDGHRIERRMVKLGGVMVAEYTLIEPPVVESVQSLPIPAGSGRSAIDDDWDWEAA